MKILAFSDLHRDIAAARLIVQASSQADIVIGAGDFATKGVGAAETIDILRELNVPFLAVAGNHDQPDLLSALFSNWNDAYLLHGSSVVIGGLSFFGLGAEIPQSSDARWNFAQSEAEAKALLAHCPAGATLVTHSPPYGHCDMQADGSHEGSLAIKDTIKTKAIRLHLCGHIHHSWGTVSSIHNCHIQNLGPTVNWFDI